MTTLGQIKLFRNELRCAPPGQTQRATSALLGRFACASKSHIERLQQSSSPRSKGIYGQIKPFQNRNGSFLNFKSGFQRSRPGLGLRDAGDMSNVRAATCACRDALVVFLFGREREKCGPGADNPLPCQLQEASPRLPQSIAQSWMLRAPLRASARFAHQAIAAWWFGVGGGGRGGRNSRGCVPLGGTTAGGCSDAKGRRAARSAGS